MGAGSLREPGDRIPRGWELRSNGGRKSTGAGRQDTHRRWELRSNGGRKSTGAGRQDTHRGWELRSNGGRKSTGAGRQDTHSGWEPGETGNKFCNIAQFFATQKAHRGGNY